VPSAQRNARQQFERANIDDKENNKGSTFIFDYAMDGGRGKVTYRSQFVNKGMPNQYRKWKGSDNPSTDPNSWHTLDELHAVYARDHKNRMRKY